MDYDDKNVKDQILMHFKESCNGKYSENFLAIAYFTSQCTKDLM